MPTYIYDIIILVIIAATLFSGYKKGFFLTLCGFLAIFVALFGALFVSYTFAPPLSNTIAPFIDEPIRTTVESHLPEDVDLDSLDAITQEIHPDFFEKIPQDLLDNIPDDISSQSISDLPTEIREKIPQEILDQIPDGVSLDTLKQIPQITQDITAVLDDLEEEPMVSGFLENFDFSVEEGVSDIVGSVSQFIALQIARIILFIISFITLLVLWFMISHTLNLAFTLPVLSELNTLAGAGIGLLQGLLYAYILSWVLSLGVLSAAEVETTFLLPIFLNYNPIPLFTSFFGG